MKTKHIIAIILTLFLFAGCDTGTSPSRNGNDIDYARSDEYAAMVSAETARANTEFALDLFAGLLESDKEKNVFISPISVSIALAMTMNGASGENFNEMRAVLGFDGWEPAAINEQFLAILQSAPSIDKDVGLYFADSMWAKQEFAPRLLAGFTSSLAEYYLTGAYTLDFADPSAPDIINGWISDHTGGHIDDIIGSIDPETVMFLINAIFFKGAWTTSFDPDQTHTGTFTKGDGSQVQCEFMGFRDMQTLSFLENDDCKAVRLPYGRGRAALYAIAPKSGTLKDFAGTLTAEGLDTMIASMHEREVPVSFPKFSLEYEKSLVEALQALGMERAFVEGGFMNLATDGEGLFIMDVLHKSYIEVTEQGTKAAAATVVIIGETSMPPAFEGNRPFIYLIRDDRNGTILFMGAMEGPE